VRFRKAFGDALGRNFDILFSSSNKSCGKTCSLKNTIGIWSCPFLLIYTVKTVLLYVYRMVMLLSSFNMTQIDVVYFECYPPSPPTETFLVDEIGNLVLLISNCLAKFISQILLFANSQNNMERRKRSHLQQFGKFHFQKSKKPLTKQRAPLNEQRDPLSMKRKTDASTELTRIFAC